MVAVAVNVGFLAAMQSGLVFEPIEAPSPITVVPVPPDTVPPPEPVPILRNFDFSTGPVVPDPIEWPDYETEAPPLILDPAPPVADGGSGLVPLPEPAISELQVNRPLAPPEYPATSLRRGEEGTVRLLIYVLPDGRVGDVKVDRSSGYKRLDEAAMATARKHWTFKPAAQGGTPVAAWGYFAVTFDLRD